MSLLYAAASAALASSVPGAVVINEVMANPRGSESGPGAPGDRNEFIELYNPGADTVDLANGTITDLDADDIITAWTDPKLLIRYPSVRIRSTKIAPGSFALILDPEYPSTDTVGGNVEPYAIPESILILTVKNSTLGDGLANSDPVVLKDKSGGTISTFGTPDSADNFPGDAGDGKSWERVAPDAADTKGGWRISSDRSGSTPGRMNSTGIGEGKRPANRLSLSSPAPDPWTVHTTIGFFLPSAGELGLELFGADGRRIGRVDEGVRAAGFHRVVVVRTDLAAGVYFFVLETKNGRATVRTTVVK